MHGRPRSTTFADRRICYSHEFDRWPTDVRVEGSIGAANVERELEYVRQHSFQAVLYTFSEKLARFEATATPLAAADAEVFLAEFLLQMGRQEEAAARLAAAAKLEPENLRLQTVLALDEIARGEHEKANLRLLSIGNPTDWLIGRHGDRGNRRAWRDFRSKPG